MGEPVVAPEAEQTVNKEPKRSRGPGAKAAPAKPKKKGTKPKADEDSRTGNRRINTDTYKSQRAVKDFVAPHLTDAVIFIYFHFQRKNWTMKWTNYSKRIVHDYQK